MKIKTMQWNIGSGRIASSTSDRSVDNPYRFNGLEHIIKLLKAEKPDIITFQEVHDGEIDQAEIIAGELGIRFFTLDHYDKSHIEEGSWISQAILMRA